MGGHAWGINSRLVLMMLGGSTLYDAATVVEIVFTLLALGLVVVGVGNATKSRHS